MSERNPYDGGQSSPAPRRPLDAAAMKAFAHPLRMEMYTYLSDHGAATATMLAAHTGESTGQTSYHLRQLERHGFIAEDSTRGKGRERWWKAEGFAMHGIELAEDRGARPAVEALLRHQVEQQMATIADWFQRADQEPPEWWKATLTSHASMNLTRDELAGLSSEMAAIVDKYAEISHANASGETEGTRRIRLYLDLFPLPTSSN